MSSALNWVTALTVPPVSSHMDVTVATSPVGLRPRPQWPRKLVKVPEATLLHGYNSSRMMETLDKVARESVNYIEVLVV